MGRLKKEFTDLEAREIIALYNTKLSLEEIASRFNCSRTPIYALLEEKRIEVHTSRKVAFEGADRVDLDIFLEHLCVFCHVDGAESMYSCNVDMSSP